MFEQPTDKAAHIAELRRMIDAAAARGHDDATTALVPKSKRAP